MRSTALTALADQLQAATTEARHHLTRWKSGHPTDARLSEAPSPWLAAHVRAFALALASGQGTLCPHVTSAPRVLHAAVWRVGVLACPACRHLLEPEPHEDHVCDACQVTAHTLVPCVAAVGPVLLAFGLCSPCSEVIAPGAALPPR